jgi:N-acetylneuraminate synthase
MIIDIRAVEIGLGKRDKAPTKEEKKNLLIARKSIVANTPIQQGDIFSEANLTVKRPGSGMQPIKIWDLIGRHSQNRYDVGELINEQIDTSNNED